MTVFLLTTLGTAVRATVQYSQTSASLARGQLQLPIISDHFFVLLSVLTTFEADSAGFCGQN
jgi:hypothetical protein